MRSELLYWHFFPSELSGKTAEKIDIVIARSQRPMNRPVPYMRGSAVILIWRRIAGSQIRKYVQSGFDRWFVEAPVSFFSHSVLQVCSRAGLRRRISSIVCFSPKTFTVSGASVTLPYLLMVSGSLTASTLWTLTRMRDPQTCSWSTGMARHALS